MLITLFIATLLAVTGGISLAAEGSLPGQTLYPVKLGVNEQVKSALTFGSENEAHWSIEQAMRRLGETVNLSANSELSAEETLLISQRLKDYLAKVDSLSDKLSAEGRVEAALRINAKASASLSTYNEMLASLSVQAEADGNLALKTNLDSIKEVVVNGLSALVGQEAELKAKLEASSDDSKMEATAGVKVAANNKISEVKKYLELKSNDISAEVAADVSMHLDLADQAKLEGDSKLEAKAYAEALVLYRSAFRHAQEAKAIIHAGLSIKAALGDPQDKARFEGISERFRDMLKLRFDAEGNTNANVNVQMDDDKNDVEEDEDDNEEDDRGDLELKLEGNVNGNLEL
ncbi:MAG: DUF5667 domain-containing protein [Candidatus Komeilibacteria bacterium]|nr:DUF5667 domain-containing protein [Candidatus Komeilibacteria bacterium]